MSVFDFSATLEAEAINSHFLGHPERFLGLLSAVCNKYGVNPRLVPMYRRRKTGTLEYGKNLTLLQWLELAENQRPAIYHRQILPFEIVLDLDEPDRIQEAVKIAQMLVGKGLDDVYFFVTGGKGIHIHIFFLHEYKHAIFRNKEADFLKKISKLAEKFAKTFGFDASLSSRNRSIGLEFAPHRKTGKLKKLIFYEGVFYGQI